MQQSLFSLIQPSISSSGSTDAMPGNTVPVLPGENQLNGLVFTVFDIETTGLNGKKNSLTELTAIQYRWQDGQVTELGMLTSMVKPTDSVSEEITRLTGITEAMVANAPEHRTVLQQFLNLIGPNPILVGHNVAFDIVFVREKLGQYGLSASVFTAERGICTRNLARKLIPGLPGYEGIVVATACDVVNTNPHRAEADVRMCAGILFALLTQLGDKVTTVGDLQAIQGPLKA